MYRVRWVNASNQTSMRLGRVGRPEAGRHAVTHMFEALFRFDPDQAIRRFIWPNGSSLTVAKGRLSL
jgi:hypothetical protein